MSVSIKIINTQAVNTFGGYYPQVGDQLTLDPAGDAMTIKIDSGFAQLQALNSATANKVTDDIFVTDWISVKNGLDVQAVFNLNPHSITFIWRVDDVVETSGISTGG